MVLVRYYLVVSRVLHPGGAGRAGPKRTYSNFPPPASRHSSWIEVQDGHAYGSVWGRGVADQRAPTQGHVATNVASYPHLRRSPLVPTY